MTNCVLHCFKNNQNQTSELNQGEYIDETDNFSFYLESDSDCGDVRIDITDIPIKLNRLTELKHKYIYVFDYESLRDYFQSQKFRIENFSKEFYCPDLKQKIWFYKLFINYPIGLCDILLIDNTNEKVIQSFNLNIDSAKINETEFDSLVKYVESKSTSIWTKHSLLKHTASPLNADDRIEWLLNFCENFVNELKEKYLHFFSFDKIKIIKQKNEIVNYSSDVSTSDESLFWLINNLDTLYPTTTYDINKIMINNRLFAPLEILSNNLEENTDTNENQIIHGFITELKLFLNQIKDTFDEDIKNCSKTTFDGRLNFYSYKRSLKRLGDINESLNEIKYYLDKYIPVTIETLDFLNTNKIESKEHYNFIFDKLIQWLLNKNATYSKDKKLFKGINRMDQLFEKACFYKLIDSFKKLEYEVQEISNNKVKLTKKGAVHYLYSQILPDKLISVRSKNGYGGNSGVLQPDFTIELENGKFIIIDAKYKKLETITRYDYPDLALKYLHGIGLKTGGFFNPMGLFMLFPRIENFIDFYQKEEYNLYSNNPVYPSIASIGLNFEEESRLLNSSIKKLLEIN
ncbi:hypothetical protein IA01_03965 [Flavobacterium psychrophilum]|uniref:Uncharacterized protein n=8 Tax=Flavobacterium psychrophilum TaxID=96345 RepID=A6GXX4_FLAPJ|nr:hypothetical protein [Flavobacterium psychrophilum]AIG29677.1 hypothetical protein IA03_03950 [Flavobacterium psychrophilum]AIG31954.1 hypothetical protein IA01_03965 [Flavobacterium psychrophilum]AIG34109.1 hypothetical protein IA02_03365 [Flavobacterium psychrophilum]AIG36472.1 hypothetical protein IA04_03865 [Flavobacterium psychrophilum]AIG38737.1 hypothetical protein IA05_03950 [Flavobacterium psychrophilum]